MIKNLLRNVIKWAMEAPPDQRAQPQPRGLTGMIREGSAPLITVWPISNGYLLVGGTEIGSMGTPTITYTKELTEIGDQIAAMRARVAIGVPNNVSLNQGGYTAIARNP